MTASVYTDATAKETPMELIVVTVRLPMVVQSSQKTFKLLITTTAIVVMSR